MWRSGSKTETYLEYADVAIGYRIKGGVDVLTEIELPRPTPGPRDLLVKVKAVSVNPVDAKRRQGESPETARVEKNPATMPSRPWVK